jgi:hypothetical protein
MTPTEREILENRYKWRLCWHEPVAAVTSYGRERTADRIVSMMVYEVIDAQRFVANRVKPDHDLDDRRLLQDFMVVHYAWVAQDKGDHDS